MFILAVTGFGVLLVLLESSIPELRGEVELEVDSEHPSGETVSAWYSGNVVGNLIAAIQIPNFSVCVHDYVIASLAHQI